MSVKAGIQRRQAEGIVIEVCQRKRYGGYVVGSVAVIRRTAVPVPDEEAMLFGIRAAGVSCVDAGAESCSQ